VKGKHYHNLLSYIIYFVLYMCIYHYLCRYISIIYFNYLFQIFISNIYFKYLFQFQSYVVGIFHTASPVKFHVEDVKKELLEPAVNGTLSVLKSAAKSPSVKCVVIASSIVAGFDYTGATCKSFPVPSLFLCSPLFSTLPHSSLSLLRIFIVIFIYWLISRIPRLHGEGLESFDRRTCHCF
jgi:hypothetical protein